MTGPLLILGASEDQLPLYREARRRRIPVVGVDRRRDRPAAPLADTFLEVSIRDARAIAAALGGIRPRAVVAAASDAGLLTWHELCERFATPYRYPLEAARVSMDKAAFRKLVAAEGLPSYRWATGRDPGELAAAGVPLPAVVKPNDGSGSKGLTRIDRTADLPAAFAHAQAYAPDGVVIMEECVEGRHFAVEVFLRDGTAAFAAVTEKRFATGFLVRAHLCPADLPEAARRSMVEAAVRLCAAMGLRDGPANFDTVLDPAGRVAVIEVNARLGGNGIPALLLASHGADTVAALLSLVLGEPYSFGPPEGGGHAALTMFGSPLAVPGLLSGCSGTEAALGVPGVLALELFAGRGDAVLPFTQSGHKIGQILAAGPGRVEVDHAIRTAQDLLRLDIVPSAQGGTHA